MKKEKVQWRYLVVFLIAGIVRTLAYMRFVRYYLRTDDFGPLLYPSILAGKNWLEYASRVKYYYGYGYYWIFTPLLKYVTDYKVLLGSIAIINSVFICLISVLAYHVATKYFNLPHKWYTMVLAACVSFFEGDVLLKSATTLYRTDNEIPFFFCCWIMIYLLCKIQATESKKTRIIFSILLAIDIVWGISVHEKAMSLMIAFVAVVIYIFLCKKKWIVQPVAFFATLIPAFQIHRMIKKAVCAFIWSKTSLTNSSSFRNVSLWFLKSLYGLRTICVVVFGNLCSFMIKTYGLPIIAIVVLIWWIIHNGIIHNIVCKIKKIDNKYKDVAIESYELVLMIFGVMFIIVVGGLAVKWGKGLHEGFVNNEVVYKYKGICYSRYYYAVASPLIVGTIAFLNSKREQVKHLYLWSLGLFVVLQAIWFTFIYPIINIDGKKETYIERACNYEMISGNFRANLALSITVYSVCFLIVIGVNRFKKIKGYQIVPFIIMGVTLVFRFQNVDFSNIGFQLNSGYEMADFQEYFVNSEYYSVYLENNDLYLEEDGHELNRLQFVCSDLSFHRNSVDENTSGLVFTTSYDQELIDQGYVYGNITKFIYIYTNKEEYYGLVSKYQ